MYINYFIPLTSYEEITSPAYLNHYDYSYCVYALYWNAVHGVSI